MFNPGLPGIGIDDSGALSQISFPRELVFVSLVAIGGRFGLERGRAFQALRHLAEA